MELKYRDNWMDLVSNEQTIKRNEILAKLDKKGKIGKKEADTLFRFEAKTRVCGRCGKGMGDKMGESPIAFMSIKMDNGVSIGLFEKCYLCEMESFMEEELLRGEKT